MEQNKANESHIGTENLPRVILKEACDFSDLFISPLSAQCQSERSKAFLLPLFPVRILL
jgi:hypothetical protein